MKIITNIFISLMACVLVLSVAGMAYTMPPLTVLGNLTLENGALPTKITGGDDDSDNMYLTSTSASTKGKIYFGTNSVFDEVNNRLGIGCDPGAYGFKTNLPVCFGSSLVIGGPLVVPRSLVPSLPPYSISGDTHTGMYSIKVDTLAFSTGGTERLNLSSSGVSSPLPLMLGAVGTPTAPAGSDIKIYAANGVPYYRNASGSYIISGGVVSGGTGDVVGPASSVADNFPSFASSSGKTLKDSGNSAASFANAITTTNALALKAASSDLWTKINKSGDTMSGPLAMGASKVTGVLNGTAAQDAVTYSQLVESGSPGAVFVGPYSDYKARFYDYVTLGDSTDTAVINAALLKSYTRGHKVILMPGVYLQSTSQIVVPPYCTLEGLNSPFQSRFASAGYPEAIPVRTAKEVARINVTQKTLGAVWLKGSATCIRNIEFFYGTQKTNSTPDVYNASIWACGNGNIPTENAIIEYINFMNAYTAVDAGSGNHDRMLMQHCIGMPLRYGLIDDLCFDIDEINDIHWNPNPVLAFSPTLIGSVLEAWVKDHGVGYKIGRSDSTRLRGCFDIWHAYGIMVVGPWYGGSITDCYMDSDSVAALWINGTMERCLVSDSSFYSAGNTAINTVSPGNCYLCKFDDNVVSATGTAFGIAITGTYNTLSDNTIIDYGDSSSQCYGIIVFGAANSIKNNLIKTTHTHTYGLYWDGAGCNVGGNSVYGAALGPNALGAGSTTYCIVGNLASGCGGAWTADSSTANKKVGLNTFI